MRVRFWHLPMKAMLPVLAGQFLSDWLWNKSLTEAVHHFPMRAIITLAVILIWSAFRGWRSARKRTFS
jgi:hypothetical protein